MAITNDATINAFYLAYYGRPADPAGLAYWSEALTASNGDFSSIVSAFSTSSEATAHLGGGSATDQISTIYQQLFGRAPDAAGLAYWTDAIASGNMTLADAAIQITNGAQSSDLTVSTLRQQVAAQFTASVAASGVAYDGDAAVEAARVLISAVNANTSAADITSLVTAGASLVQTAHDNPAIITAMANGGDLSALLSTSSGQSDPVALVQALASIGKAALTDSAGLTTLLHGGGVAGLLASLPAGTTLKDVATAVNTGGLSAGTTVATTPVDTAVTITPKIAFVGIDGHDLPSGTTLEANSIWYFIDIHGKPANSTTTFQVSSTGTGDWKTVAEDALLDNGTYYVRYIVKDAAGNSGTSNTLKLVMDTTLASPVLQLSHDTGTAGDLYTSNGEVQVTGLRTGETWSYSFDGKTWTAGTTDANGVGLVEATGADGVQHLTVRTIENVSGNSAFTSTAFNYTLDTSAPAQGLKLGTVTHTDTTHATVVFTYTGTIDLKSDALFYRIDSNNWSSADDTIIDTVNKTVTFKNVDLSSGDAHISLETNDGAGNKVDVNAVIAGALVAPTVALYADTGASNTDHVTNNGNISISGLASAPGSSWAYSTDGGATWTTGATPENGQFDLYSPATGSQTLLVHNIDAAGNVGADTTFSYTFDPYINARLNITGFDNFAEVTVNNAHLVFNIGLYGTHSTALSTVYQISTTGNDGDFATWDATHTLTDGTYYFRAIVSDTAGNVQTTQPVTVHLDNTAPAVPTVALSYDSGTPGDSITDNSYITVNGLESGGKFDYSVDGGQTWIASDNTAYNGTDSISLGAGEHTVVVRGYDAAGNVSAASAPLHYTVDPMPLAGLTLDHIEGGAAGAVETSLNTADVVFSYTGQFVSGDTLSYVIGDTRGTVDADDIDPDNPLITVDTANHKITLHDVDLTSSNPYVGISSSNAAGDGWSAGNYISGPSYSYFWDNDTAAGLNVSAAVTGKHIYLTDGGISTAIGDTESYQLTSFGEQASVLKGVLGVGTSAASQTVNGSAVYALGTADGDVLTGSRVWGFGGDDSIKAVADTNGQAMIFGGAGADVIHAEGVSTIFGFAGASDSSIVTDTNTATAAHGFDTLYVGGDGSTTQYFNFTGTTLTSFTSIVAADHDAVLAGGENGSALLALINTAVGDTFTAHAGTQQAAFIDFGAGASGEVNYLVVDTDSDGHIGAGDYVVEIIGSVTGGEVLNNSGSVLLQVPGVA